MSYLGLRNGTVDVNSLSNTVPVSKGGTGAVTLTGLVKGNGSGAMTAAVANTDYQSPITITGLVKSAGAGVIAQAVAGTDYIAPSVYTNFTAPQRASMSAEIAPTAGAITWDITTTQILRVNLNANLTSFSLSGTLANFAGVSYVMVVRYNAGTTISWPGNIKWSSGTAPTLTATAGKLDMFFFSMETTDGSNYYLCDTGNRLNVG